ncbi:MULTISPECIES: DUF484 family protein [unclassified Pseudoalteromonas]|uniref:DUF484 family protein n=1 Tax=unclassified Pseudoalteromonas TaxID=194690 RepID=UPI000CF69856|nr:MULTISPECIES: DUF484 family protein [unclassified Pseudoalteromonas]MBS3799328.1 DUF484 family protein [Pseudoalteromonas sp. BDTF-M6]
MSELSKEQIADYLKDNPDFLLQHPEVFAAMNLGATHESVASLQLRQQQVLREQNRALQQQLQQLVAQAKQNEKVFQVFSACHRQLMRDAEFVELAAGLEALICEQLQISECKLIKFTDELQPLLDKRLEQNNHYLGRLSEQEQALIFAGQSKSAALYLIGELPSPLAILAFASEDELHFEPAQDSLFIFEFVKALQERLTALS